MASARSPVPKDVSQGRGVPPAVVAVASEDDVDDASTGQWLFKRGDLVLGPVSAAIIMERIRVGELSGDTPVARDGQAFRPMKAIRVFREAHDALLRARKKEQEEQAHRTALRRAQTLRVVIYVALMVFPAAAGALAGHWLAVHQPWDDTPQWIARVPVVVGLPNKPLVLVQKPMVPPDEALATENNDAGNDEKEPPENKKRDKKDTVTAKKKDDDGGIRDLPQKGPLPETLTNEQAYAPIKSDSRVTSALKACLKAESETNPEMPGEVMLEYTVTELGRAANVKLTNRELRDRPVQKCVQDALALARWLKFSGERKNVSVPLRIKKPAAATSTKTK